MTDPTPAPAASNSSGALSTPPAGTDYPGKTLGIVGLVLAILLPIVGLIISIIANNQSKAAGYKNSPAKIGIIVGIILTILYLIFLVIVPLVLTAAVVNSGVTY